MCSILAVLCVTALIQGVTFERRTKEAAESFIKDTVERARAVTGEIFRRGMLSDVPVLRVEAEALIRLCGLLKQEKSPIERDHLVESWQIADRIEDLEKRFGEVLPVEDDGKFLG